MINNHFHTIIIGAGPGGLSCARLLAQHGKKVLVLEKNPRIGPKICAGGITLAGVSRAIPPQLIDKEFRCQHISSGRQQAIIFARHPIVSTLKRHKLGQWQAQQARAAGATIKTNCPVRAINGTEVDTSNTTYTADFLVGADGANSLVRRHLGVPAKHLGRGIHYHLKGDFPQMLWHLDPRRFNTGYSWIFPQNGRASIGAYCAKDDLSARQLKEGLHNWLDDLHIDWRGHQLEAAHINFDYQGWQFGSTFLVGDAAGLASGLTGEGILPAIISGQEVARHILDNKASCLQLRRLIKHHRRHIMMLRLAGSNPLLCRVIMETLIMALRLHLLSFANLEMAH